MPIGLGAAIVGAAVIGGATAVIGSSMAAGAQRDAANSSIQAQNAANQQVRSDLQPYRDAGQTGLNDLTSRLGELTTPFNMTQANLEATPGYQFNLDQGLKAVDNSMGARGLMNSGAVIKGAGQYATGLANSTYTDQYNMYNNNQTQAYNKLMGVANLGLNAAGTTAQSGLQTAHDVGQTYQGRPH